MIRDQLTRTRELVAGPGGGRIRGAKATGHRITIHCRPGRAPANVVARWTCSCGAGGMEFAGKDAARSNADADKHLAENGITP